MENDLTLIERRMFLELYQIEGDTIIACIVVEFLRYNEIKLPFAQQKININ